MILHPAFPILNFLELYLYTDCGLIVLGAELTKFPPKKRVKNLPWGYTEWVPSTKVLPKFFYSYSFYTDDQIYHIYLCNTIKASLPFTP